VEGNWADRTVERLVRSPFAVLVCGLGRIDRLAQLALCGAEVLLGFNAVAHHVVVIGITCMLHLLDGFYDMLVDSFEIMPVVKLRG